MSLLITADWQLSSNRRDAYRFDNLIQLADIIEREHASHLLILGDLTEEKNFHPDWLVNDIVELLYNFSCMCPVIVLEGNHDAAGNRAYFEFLGRVPNVRWIGLPTRITLDGVSCLFLPHTDNPEAAWSKAMFDPLPTWIFAHHTFAEVKTESGFHLRGTPLSILPTGAHVVSGDMHTPQVVKDGQRSVTYVGAHCTIDFGDDFEPRVLLIHGTELTSIPMTGAQKRLIEMQDGIEINDRPWRPGDIVKIRYHLRQEERERWPQIKAEIRQLAEAAGAIVHAVMPVMPEAKALAPRMSRRQRSDEQMLADFGQRQKVPGPTLEAGMEIVKAV